MVSEHSLDAALPTHMREWPRRAPCSGLTPPSLSPRALRRAPVRACAFARARSRVTAKFMKSILDHVDQEGLAEFNCEQKMDTS